MHKILQIIKDIYDMARASSIEESSVFFEPERITSLPESQSIWRSKMLLKGQHFNGNFIHKLINFVNFNSRVIRDISVSL